MIKASGVYLLENQQNKKCYVGSSKNIEARIKTHFRDLRNNRHLSKEMQKDYNNGDNITASIIRIVAPVHSILLQEEGRAIKEYTEKGFTLYNAVAVAPDRLANINTLKNTIVDLYCKEKYGKTFSQLTAHFSPTKYEMFNCILLNPDREKEIRAEYEPIISYENRLFYAETHMEGGEKN